MTATAETSGTARGGEKARGTFYRLAETGLAIDDEVSFGQWEGLGKYLGTMEKGLPWLLGDWLIYGMAVFPDAYSQAMDATGLALGTLKNYKYVCGKIPFEERRRDLSFAHHYEVADMGKGPRAEWLAQAAKEHWTAKDLRYRVSGGRVGGGFGQPTIYDPNDPANVSNATDWLARAKDAYSQMTPADQLAFLQWLDVQKKPGE